MIDFFFPDLSVRSHEQELMDLPDCNEKKLINTVKQFSLINYLFTNSRNLIKKHFFPEMIKMKNNEISFLDIGAGGCDIPIWLVKKCKKMNLKINITCLDYDRKIIQYAEHKCKFIKEIHIVHGDAFKLDKMEKYDFIFTNHFLHHLPDNKISLIIKLIYENCKRRFLLNDIYRSNSAYFGYTLFTGVFMHNSFAFYDGRMSIKKSFLADEIQQYLNKSGYKNNIKILKSMPSRIYLLGIKK